MVCRPRCMLSPLRESTIRIWYCEDGRSGIFLHAHTKWVYVFTRVVIWISCVYISDGLGSSHSDGSGGLLRKSSGIWWRIANQNKLVFPYIKLEISLCRCMTSYLMRHWDGMGWNHTVVSSLEYLECIGNVIPTTLCACQRNRRRQRPAEIGGLGGRWVVWKKKGPGGAPDNISNLCREEIFWWCRALSGSFASAWGRKILENLICWCPTPPKYFLGIDRGVGRAPRASRGGDCSVPEEVSGRDVLPESIGFRGDGTLDLFAGWNFVLNFVWFWQYYFLKDPFLFCVSLVLLEF